ncbi:glycosyltransferase [Cronobacter dublinensis]|uniref:glycosyltransferase n=1 Tax=Cronobacter dublinensis TaxID=413497 RepID=UPI0023DD4C85|nr:glycosyltransferase [Cronobacter dublinensis]MDT3664901.1 glycosyltransferase [Cronobacter dublinensis]WEP43972.1 glycosyltransferase [Cronobacter dublinensis]
MEVNSIEHMAATKVAAIMSVYKNDKVLPLYLALKSLECQRHKIDYIFIRLDGPVSNEIKRLIACFVSNSSKFFIFESETNIGLAKSMNVIIDIIINHHKDIGFIARMDADDICRLERINKQMLFLERYSDVMVLGSACKEFGLYNKTIVKHENDEEIKENIIRVTPFIHPTVIFRRCVFEYGFRYPENTHLSEDLSFWLLLAAKNIKFHNLQDVLLDYRLTNATLARRIGISKAWAEFQERTRYVFSQKKNIMTNLIFILGHFFIRLMPIQLVRILYRILR